MTGDAEESVLEKEDGGPPSKPGTIPGPLKVRLCARGQG